MKKAAFFCIFIAIILLSAVTVNASEKDAMQSIIDSAEKPVADLLEDLGIQRGTYDELINVELTDVFKVIKQIVIDRINMPVETMIYCFILLVLITFANSFLTDNDHAKIINSIGVAMVAFTALLPIENVLDELINCGHAVADFTKVLIPILAAFLTISGCPTAALCVQGTSFGIVQFFSDALSVLIGPFSVVYVSLITASSVNHIVPTQRMAMLIKKGITYMLTLSSGLFSALLSIKSVLSVSADKISIRGFKFLIGTSVPVVGSALSESLSSVIASIGLLKNAGAAIGLILLFLYVCPILFELVLWSVSMKILTLFSQLFSQNALATYFESMDGLFTLFCAVIIYQTFLYVVALILVMLINNN